MRVGPRLLLSAFMWKPTSAFLEWLAYHRTLGVTQTVIYVDRRQDGKEPLLDALAAAGVIDIVPVSVDSDIKEEIHNSAIRAACIEAAETGGYGLYLAPDEYFCISDPSQSLPALMQSCGDADVLCAPVHLAGIAPKRPHIPGGLLQHAISLAGTGTQRSVTRLGLFASRTPERPVGPVQGDADLVWVNGDGSVIPAPQSLAGATGPAQAGSKASILKIPAPSVETYLVHQQALPAKQHPSVAVHTARLEALAASTGGRWTVDMRPDATSAEVSALLALPDVAAAQAALCDAETTTRENLRNTSPDFQAVIAALNGEAPAKTMEPSKPIIETDETSIADDDPRPEGGAKLPRWFAEIHTSGDKQGFYTRLKNHAVSFVERDPARLVVTFDNLSSVNDMSAEREPWAYKFVHDNGFSHLSVMARRKDWFRDPQLITYLQKLSSDGFFAGFDKVILTGTSMGGFAALAFASLSPGATVISFNPQTTLEEALVPWEERFAVGRARDWSLPHSDCAFEIDDVKKAYVIYDPFFTPDRRHVERLESDRLILLKTWCSGHYSPVFLRRAGLLKPLMQHAFDDTLTPAVFYDMIRARRALPWYRKALIANLQARGHDQLAARVTPAFRKLKRERAE